MPDAKHLPLNVLTPWAAGMGSPRRALTTLESRINGKSEKRGFRKIRFWDRWYPTFDSNDVGACQRPALPGLRFSIFPGTCPAGFFHWLEASDHRLPARTSCGLPGVEPLRHRNESLDSDIQQPLTAFTLPPSPLSLLSHRPSAFPDLHCSSGCSLRRPGCQWRPGRGCHGCRCRPISPGSGSGCPG